MMLSELIATPNLDQDVLVRGISEDSRSVAPGEVFCALNGASANGLDFVADAIERGAAAVLVEDSATPLKFQSVPVVAISALRTQLGQIASRYYKMPSENVLVIAVTGTNGKTSFTHLLAQALTSVGIKCGVVGTMGHGVPGNLIEPGLTTPPAIDLQRRIRDLADQNCSAIVLEASSHGLVQERLTGTSIDVAVLTNITRDHLDYHDTFESYQRAKQSLFQVASLQKAVINIDDEYSIELIASIDDSVSIVGFSLSDTKATVSCRSVKHSDQGIEISVKIPGGIVEARLPLYGTFNVQNVLAVVASLVSMDWTAEQIKAALGKLTPVAGRMEIMTGARMPNIIIDYAHTPDALQKCLEAVRAHFSGSRISCVFGCGGDRDVGKRPIMGEIASRLADQVYLTSDNPRSEDPEQILAEIITGVSHGSVRTIVERREAILTAIGEANNNDVVVIAGKGHEDYQETATGRQMFSDHTVINEAFSEMSDGKDS